MRTFIGCLCSEAVLSAPKLNPDTEGKAFDLCQLLTRVTDVFMAALFASITLGCPLASVRATHTPADVME